MKIQHPAVTISSALAALALGVGYLVGPLQPVINQLPHGEQIVGVATGLLTILAALGYPPKVVQTKSTS